MQETANEVVVHEVESVLFATDETENALADTVSDNGAEDMSADTELSPDSKSYLKEKFDEGLRKMRYRTCQRCHKTWRPRKENPAMCPYCHSRRWDGRPHHEFKPKDSLSETVKSRLALYANIVKLLKQTFPDKETFVLSDLQTIGVSTGAVFHDLAAFGINSVGGKYPIAEFVEKVEREIGHVCPTCEGLGYIAHQREEPDGAEVR